MSSTNTGGPAFPYSALQPGGPTMYADSEGMTLRDYFAAKAMQALIAHEERAKQIGSHNLGDFDIRVAVAAHRYADAMLKARSAT